MNIAFLLNEILGILMVLMVPLNVAIYTKDGNATVASFALAVLVWRGGHSR